MDPDSHEVQVDDGIGDQLSRPVIGDIAAAVGLFDLDATFRERGLGRDQVPGRTGPPGDGDDRRVVLRSRRKPRGVAVSRARSTSA